jgi:hypothetical protein
LGRRESPNPLICYLPLKTKPDWCIMGEANKV